MWMKDDMLAGLRKTKGAALNQLIEIVKNASRNPASCSSHGLSK